MCSSDLAQIILCQRLGLTAEETNHNSVEQALKKYVAMFNTALPEPVTAALTSLLGIDDEHTEQLDEALIGLVGQGIDGINPMEGVPAAGGRWMSEPAGHSMSSNVLMNQASCMYPASSVFILRLFERLLICCLPSVVLHFARIGMLLLICVFRSELHLVMAYPLLRGMMILRMAVLRSCFIPSSILGVLSCQSADERNFGLNESNL